MTRCVSCQSDVICDVFLYSKPEKPKEHNNYCWPDLGPTYSTSRFLIVFPDPKTSATRDTMGS